MLKRISSILVVLVICFSISSIYIFYPSLPQAFDDRIKDFMFNLRGEEKPKSDNIIIIDIDEKSLRTLGQWPWSRNILGKILQNLDAAQIGIIGLDIVFAEEDRTSPHKIFEEFDIKKENIPNYDFEFAQTIASTPTILGYQFEFVNNEFINKTAPSIQTIFIEKNKKEGEEYLIKAKGTILNIPVIQDNSYSSGFFNNIPDDSGIIRSVPLILSYDEEIYPSLALETLRIALGIKKIIVNYDQNGVSNLILDNFIIPTDRHGRILVNFRGKEKTFKYISALDIYNNNFKSEEIRDKIALIGTSAAALMDLRATPFESIFPGVEVHANVIDNILNKDFLFKPSWIEAINICLIFVLSFFIYFIIRKVPIILTPIFIFISLYLIFYINYFILFKYGLVINTLFPFITIILSSAVSLVIGYFYEIKKKEEIKSKFASKVSKSVMEELIKDVDNNHLKVQNKEITIFFSDIREFTQISEKLDSAEIVIDYLNKYLTPMSEIINKYDGTIDKYIGDCIMAYWNAPFDIKNHADKALKSAIQQLNILKDINKNLKDINQPMINIGIGITTGIATIGEIGSIGRSDFTIIGDNVNIASRVESLCKYYKCNLIITQDTKANLKEKYTFRYLDLIRVKGKEKAIKIWEVINSDDIDIEEKLNLYNDAIELYYKKEFKKALEIFKYLTNNSNEEIYKIYKQRCESYLIDNKEFNEVFVHIEK